MNTIDKDRLYKLLPYIYQLRDYEQGEPLRALLQVISGQVEIVEEDITQLTKIGLSRPAKIGLCRTSVT